MEYKYKLLSLSRVMNRSADFCALVYRRYKTNIATASYRKGFAAATFFRFKRIGFLFFMTSLIYMETSYCLILTGHGKPWQQDLFRGKYPFLTHFVPEKSRKDPVRYSTYC